MAAPIPYFTLNNGTKIPSVGLGCWMGEPGQGDRATAMCKNALDIGYRLFDTAFEYGNEAAVGRAIKETDVPRSEIYVTTKLSSCDHHRVQEAFERSLKDLDCEYIDLYLMHWPQTMLNASSMSDPNAKLLGPDEHPTFIDTWKDMEKLLNTGKVKTIGVSNFSIKLLTELFPHCVVIPAVNQVELHPFLPQDDLKSFCDDKGILLTAYSPLGQSLTKEFLSNPVVKGISDKLNITPGQVLLSWGVQRGTVVIPKSEDKERLATNITIAALPVEDMKALNDVHKQPGQHRSMFSTDEPLHLGWSYEQLGWNLTKGAGGFIV